MDHAPAILIVDESAQNVSNLRRAFRQAGVGNPIQWARSGAEARAYLRGEAPFDDRNRSPLPSVIVLDLALRTENGFELLDWIRGQFPCGGLLVVVLTHLEELRQINRAYRMGANSFLTKPGNAEEIHELIRIFSGYWVLHRPAGYSGQPEVLHH